MKIMKIKRAMIFVLAIALFAGLQSEAALANSLEQGVADDGSLDEILAIESQAQAGKADSFRGTGLRTEEALNAEGVSLEQPDFAAIRAMKPMVKGGPGIETVIGVDRRARVYTTDFPSRAVALVTFSDGTTSYYCTGFLIGANTVITAGHCLHSGGSSGSWYLRTSYRIYPGYNATSAPYGSCTANSLRSVVGWTQNGDDEYDYGAIKLNCTVGNTTGWYGFRWQTTTLNNRPSIVPGYPNNRTPARSQWWGADKIRYTTAQKIFYSNDTYSGNSGGPVWEDLGNSGAMVNGVHGYSIGGPFPYDRYNSGKRITEATFNNFVYWRNLP